MGKRRPGVFRNVLGRCDLGDDEGETFQVLTCIAGHRRRPRHIVLTWTHVKGQSQGLKTVFANTRQPSELRPPPTAQKRVLFSNRPYRNVLYLESPSVQPA